MKKNLLSISLTLIVATTFGQWLDDNYDLNFEDTLGLQHLTIDTNSNSNNIWQVGTPQKIIFTNAFSIPKAILTDTINAYPTNDTSVFIITNVAFGGGFEWPHTAILAGQYNVNSDTLTDYGKIEFSPDNGTKWIDMLNDTVLIDTALNHYWYWDSYDKPTLTGNSNGWKYFWINLAELGHFYNVHDGDTVLYRFSFISDSVQTNKDGLMFDDFHFEDYVEGIEGIQNDNLVSISPNPTSDELTILTKKFSDKQSIQIYSFTGQLLYENTNFKGEKINTRQLSNGIYLLKYSDAKSFAVKKLIINH